MNRWFFVVSLIIVFGYLAGCVSGQKEPQQGDVSSLGSHSPEDKWLSLRDVDLEVTPGSALDFSFMWDGEPAGHQGRILADASGLAFENSGQRARFLCASQPYGIEDGLPPKELAHRYARQIRLHGYNLARLYFLDTALMRGREADFDFDPVQVDRLLYFLSALKDEGVYWMFDGMTSWNAAMGGLPDRWQRVYNVKLGLYFDPAQQQHWKELVRLLITMQNKYTGMRVLDDPALAGLILVNEGGLQYLWNLDPQMDVRKPFATWLAARYGSRDLLAQSWMTDEQPLAEGESFEDGMNLPEGRQSSGPRMRDVQRFFHDAEIRTSQWMSEYVHGLGYKGLITSYNNYPSATAHGARAHLPWVDMHAYHDHPTAFVTPGSTVQQTSSLEGRAGYIGILGTSRYWGQPYTVSEYGQPFWNVWRRESGLSVAAYASLQDWDMICQHASGPAELAYGGRQGTRWQAIYPFGVALDPVLRAGETLAALLYRRGDVRPSANAVTVMLDDNLVFGSVNGAKQLPQDIQRLTFIAGVGLHWPVVTRRSLVRPGLEIIPALDQGDKVSVIFDRALSLTGAPLTWEKRLEAIIETMKTQEMLSASNATNVSAGVYESDTGEILREEKLRRLSVVTPRTEAVVFDEALPIDLGHMTVQAADGPALVALASIDGRPLGESERMLLILSTDAQNTGQRFTDDARRTLESLGTLPVQLLRRRVELRVSGLKAGDYEMYGLALNGQRKHKIDVAMSAGSYEIRLDNALTGNEPTIYFELTKTKND